MDEPGLGTRLRRVPGYIWTSIALVVGVFLGGALPEPLQVVADGTALLISGIVAIVPILILVALSPAIATLIRRGLAGRFAASVVLWYVMSSAVAGLLGLIISSLFFRIPLTTSGSGGWNEAVEMLRLFLRQSGASLPLIAIASSLVIGVVGSRVERLYRALARCERMIAAAGSSMAMVMVPLILLFGISLGVKFGARLGMGHYFTMTLFTAILCGIWLFVYVFGFVGNFTSRRVKPIITGYYIPTALFAAGTCSSLATLPVNLANVKKVGVRDEVADFVVPFGAVANMDASALMYVAYAPFVVSRVFGMEISWVTMLLAAPALVLFTIAAPGLPAGMGTALWTATLFASMLGLQGPQQSDFVLTWLALSGGLPDMFRTATNCTGDGFTAIVFDAHFDRFKPS